MYAENVSATQDALTDCYVAATAWHAGRITTEEATEVIRAAVAVFDEGLEVGTQVEGHHGRIRYEVRDDQRVIAINRKTGDVWTSLYSRADVTQMVADGEMRVVSSP